MEWKDKVGSFRQIDVRGIQGNFFQGLKKQAVQLPAGSGLEITKETKLSDLLGQYPWLKEELSKVNDKFKMLNTPMDKTLCGMRSSQSV